MAPLSEGQKSLLATIRDFVNKEIIPVAEKLISMADLLFISLTFCQNHLQIKYKLHGLQLGHFYWDIKAYKRFFP